MTFNFLGPGLTVNVEAKVKEQIILDSSGRKRINCPPKMVFLMGFFAFPPINLADFLFCILILKRLMNVPAHLQREPEFWIGMEVSG